MKSDVLCAAALLLAAAPAGCSPGPPVDYWPQASPLGEEVESVHVPLDPSADPVARDEPVEPTGDLLLGDAIALTLLGSPGLTAFAWNIRAQEAAIIQAGLYPNPELKVEIEDFGGSGAFSGFDGSETTIALRQTVVLAGKVPKRVEVSRLERDLAGWDYEAARVEALTFVATDFVETIADQDRLALAQDIERLAGRIFSTIDARVQAGKVSPLERTKAGIELAQATLERQQAVHELEAARLRLAANWGSAAPRFERAVGELNQVQAPPSQTALAARIEHNPDLARWATEMALRRASIRLARAEAVPDVTLFAGPKLLEGGDETAVTAGVSIPLSIFDRNQGNILAARIRQAQAGSLRLAVEVRLRADLGAAYQALDAAYVETQAIHIEIEPRARVAFEAAEEAFRHGKIGSLELLDSQRTLFSVRRQHVDALAAYHQAVIAIERLIGSPLHVPEPQRVQP